MQLPILIIGQGLAGTLLSFELYQQQVPFLVLDDGFTTSASVVASGVMNPVTGRQAHVTWEVDLFFAKALETYQALERFLGVALVKKTPIISCPNNPEMRLAYDKQLTDGSKYIHAVEEPFTYLHQPFGKVAIQPSYLINVHSLLYSWRQFLQQKQLLKTAVFNEDLLEFHEDKLQYQGQNFGRVIYANGAAAATSSYWQNLPFALNKGEALLLDIPALAKDYLYKSGIFSVVPWQNQQWWVGSSYDNHFTTPFPTQAFAKQKLSQLANFITLPATQTAHVAAIRPSTVDRKPIIGFHPKWNLLGLFNGLGTKGVSMAPALAASFVQQILHRTPLTVPNAQLERFHKILNR
jgi:hypothetical protein